MHESSSSIWELLSFQHCIKIISINVWARYFVWSFKGTLWNSTQNILPIHWKICIRWHCKKTYLSMYGQDICVEFLRYPLKFHTKYLAYTLKDLYSIEKWNWRAPRFMSMKVCLKCPSRAVFRSSASYVVQWVVVGEEPPDTFISRENVKSISMGECCRTGIENILS